MAYESESNPVAKAAQAGQGVPQHTLPQAQSEQQRRAAANGQPGQAGHTPAVPDANTDASLGHDDLPHAQPTTDAGAAQGATINQSQADHAVAEEPASHGHGHSHTATSRSAAQAGVDRAQGSDRLEQEKTARAEREGKGADEAHGLRASHGDHAGAKHHSSKHDGAKQAAGEKGGAAASTLGPKLVPTGKGVLLGAAAGAFVEGLDPDVALREWEKKVGRHASVAHCYHRGDEVFPSKADITLTREKATPRILMMNWKTAYPSKDGKRKPNWADVAAGKEDKRIDAAAERFKEFKQPFFLLPHHEPENDVGGAGSGATAKDYAAMFRHVVERLRHRGAENIVPVWSMMGLEKWLKEPWWKDLYPGNDVVGWIGWDAYLNAEKGYNHGDFASLLARSGGKDSPTKNGIYEWCATNHPNAPIMLSEFGVYHRVGVKANKAVIFDSVLEELKKHEKIKALVMFDTPKDSSGDRDIRVDSDAASIAAFRKLVADPIFDVKFEAKV